MTDILFVCVQNAGRSQMAKALFNWMAEKRGLRLRAESAGTEPADRAQEYVVRTMREWELDLSETRPQKITDSKVEQARKFITMGCAVDAETCPAIRSKDIEDWGLDDPAGESIQQVRSIRDEVARHVDRLIATLNSEAGR